MNKQCTVLVPEILVEAIRSAAISGGEIIFPSGLYFEPGHSPREYGLVFGGSRGETYITTLGLQIRNGIHAAEQIQSDIPQAQSTGNILIDVTEKLIREKMTNNPSFTRSHAEISVMQDLIEDISQIIMQQNTPPKTTKMVCGGCGLQMEDEDDDIRIKMRRYRSGTVSTEFKYLICSQCGKETEIPNKSHSHHD